MIVQLICGDCLEVMNSLDSGSFDMVFTSPPFKDEDVGGSYWTYYDSWFKGMVRVASKVVCIIHSSTKINQLIANYPPKRMMIWGKGIIQASYRYNPILVYQISDDYKVNKYIWSDTFGIAPIIGSNKIHKYQDPLVLYSTVISMFKGCKTVLDPFVGSGTTLLACKELGLDGTGIEIDKDTFDKTHRVLDESDIC